MDSLLKFFGFGQGKDKPALGFSDNKQIETDTSSEPQNYSVKQLDKWLEKNIPKHENSKEPLRRKVFDLVLISCFMVGTVYFYKKDIHKFTRREQFRYKWFTGCMLAGLTVLLYSRWADDGIYRPVVVKREPDDTDFDIRMKELKLKLFPPGSVNLYDKYVLGKESESSSISDSNKVEASDKS